MEVLRDSLRDNSLFRRRLQNEYKYIWWMNTRIQYNTEGNNRILSGESRNIMVVGDDSQSIYSFRGANYENILRFPQKYPIVK
jgi:DNA helicase-2/ATP-dependent DNA helicase PcrA